MEGTVPQSTGVMKKLSFSGSKSTMIYLIVALLVVSGGVFTGWKVSGASSSGIGNSGPAAPGAKVQEMEAGIADEATFKDTATGTLQVGGIKGEGTHNLLREGGEMQQVALTSTVIDLDSFVDKKVQIWGQTLTGQKAYWLMDVGKLKVVQ